MYPLFYFSKGRIQDLGRQLSLIFVKSTFGSINNRLGRAFSVAYTSARTCGSCTPFASYSFLKPGKLQDHIGLHSHLFLLMGFQKRFIQHHTFPARLAIPHVKVAVPAFSINMTRQEKRYPSSVQNIFPGYKR